MQTTSQGGIKPAFFSMLAKSTLTGVNSDHLTVKTLKDKVEGKLSATAGVAVLG